jgi:hypothetical protein
MSRTKLTPLPARPCTAHTLRLPLSGLKARATLAWGNTPGHTPLTLSGLKARAKMPDPATRNCMNLNHFPSKLFFFPHFLPKNHLSSPKTT